MSGRRICIVTPGYIASSPRSVKEADALHGAGYDVRVVFSEGGLYDIRSHDARVLQRSAWRAEAVKWGPLGSVSERSLYLFSGIRHRAFSGSAGGHLWPAAAAEARVFPELARAAAREKADLYIGHYPGGLAAAASAASKHGTLLGYDAEDLHAAEQRDDPAGRRKTSRIKAIEAGYLGRCVHLTAVSEGVARAIGEAYQVTEPTVIHNAFAWSDRSSIDGLKKDRRGERLSLCWFSQTVGLDRGVQDILRSIAPLRGKVELHIRGRSSEATSDALKSLARQQGVAEDVFFHEPCAPDELLSRIAEHDIGFACEPPANDNKSRTASNKIFFYMTAGLALAVSDTPGQRAVFETCPDAGLLYASGDHRTVGCWLTSLSQDPSKLKRHKEASLEAARTRWNWERESQVLVASVRRALS